MNNQNIDTSKFSEAVQNLIDAYMELMKPVALNLAEFAKRFWESLPAEEKLDILLKGIPNKKHIIPEILKIIELEKEKAKKS